MTCLHAKRLVLVLVVVGVAFLLALPCASAEGRGREKDKLPPGLAKQKKWGWEGGRPPGWSEGEKKGWRTNLPPGLAKKAGAAGIAAFEAALSAAGEKIRKKAKAIGLIGRIIEDILVSTNLAARNGAPISETAELVGAMLDYNQSPDGIGRATKALAHGVNEEVELKGMGRYVQQQLEDGLRGDDLSLAIYEELDRRKEAP